MNFLKIYQYILFTTLAIFMINGCSSQQIVTVSKAHAYNNDYGIVQDSKVDAMLRAEDINMQNQVIEKEDKEVHLEPGTFLAEDYIQPPEVITYKYQFDPKFYSKAEWRKMP